MPDSYPDYPRHRQILDYTREFADAHGLREQIRFGTAVTESDHEGDRWIVRLADGVPAHLPGPDCATGTTWSPRMPTIPDPFNGEVRHTVTGLSPGRHTLAGRDCTQRRRGGAVWNRSSRRAVHRLSEPSRVGYGPRPKGRDLR
jgi:hypothetical protein